MSTIDPNLKLSNDVANILFEMATDFIIDLADTSCNIAKQRSSNTVEDKDIYLCLQRNWDINIPGASGSAVVPSQPALSTLQSSNIERCRS